MHPRSVDFYVAMNRAVNVDVFAGWDANHQRLVANAPIDVWTFVFLATLRAAILAVAVVWFVRPDDV